MTKVSDRCAIGAGGEYSDYQAILEMIEDITCDTTTLAGQPAS